MRYALLNVFTRGPHTGNQLAVVEAPTPLSDERMQSIAHDFNFSETVFVTENNLRIFTPKSELPFAGHPTLGAAWWLARTNGLKTFTLNPPFGEVAIEMKAGSPTLTFPGTPVISNYAGDLSGLLGFCHVLESCVQTELVRLVNVGPEFLVIPLTDYSALTNARPPLGFSEAVKCYFVFQESSSTYRVRMFSPNLSANEDAATGSAACALGGFLRDVKGLSEGSVSLYQGEEMGRPSLLQLSWNDSIRVGGQVELWAEGILT